MSAETSLEQVRAVADAVLYEGYLLYPYRASSRKNQSRWQFGVLGPPGAAAATLGEEPGMAMQCLLANPQPDGAVTIHLRFLQLQVREAQRRDAGGDFVGVDELTVAGVSVLSWDEAVEREITLPPQALLEPADIPIEVSGGQEVELLTDANGTVVGRIVRRRWPLLARLRMHTTVDDGFLRLAVSVRNEHPETPGDKDAAIRTSLIGAHLLLEARGADFSSLLEPPAEAGEAAARCEQRRCWPVLAGAPGSTGVVLAAPIILYDYPTLAEQSHGALFDSTEIDEILTLRVMTMTDDEKAEARATDPLAQAIIDRCDGMSAADLQQLHGILRDPHAPAPPEAETVLINGVSVGKDSLVRVQPTRRADAQDIFFTGQVARVTTVLRDVDGGVHVAVVLVDDPAADLHEWYGRYLYFAPDELTPVNAESLNAEAQP
jgi:hypothetical protein